MQNNVTELTQKLLGALDGDYNVTNMATIIEVITYLEKATITKEMLETTRLGKHINELRKHLANDALAKRAKLLVKKWRQNVLEANLPTEVNPVAVPALTTNGQMRNAAPIQDDGGGAAGGMPNRKRPASRQDSPAYPKKHRVNGGSNAQFDYDFSDNSNSSFKDLLSNSLPVKPPPPVLINSDSNSSMHDALREPGYEDQPKKRGRKKGSKNHKNLIAEAESSFSNKMAVSRGNAKVKTTQELIESLQNRTLPPAQVTPVSPARTDDWRERAAKLTERVSLIDQKLNSGGNRVKKHKSGSNHHREGALLTPPLQHQKLRGSTLSHISRPASPADGDDEEEIIVVDDMPAVGKHRKRSLTRTCANVNEGGDTVVDPVRSVFINPGPVSLSEEEALSRLPPITAIAADEEDTTPCWCVLEYPEEAPQVQLDEADPEQAPPVRPPPTFRVHGDCPAHKRLKEKYRLNDVGDERVALLHAHAVENSNGNFGEARLQCDTEAAFTLYPPALPPADGSDLPDVKIVPNFYQLPAKSEACSETYKKYSISEPPPPESGPGPGSGDEQRVFREYHECLDRPSYNGESLRILPYVIID